MIIRRSVFPLLLHFWAKCIPIILQEKENLIKVLRLKKWNNRIKDQKSKEMIPISAWKAPMSQRIFTLKTTSSSLPITKHWSSGITIYHMFSIFLITVKIKHSTMIMNSCAMWRLTRIMSVQRRHCSGWVVCQ